MPDLTDQQIAYKTIVAVAGDAGIRALQEARGGMEIHIPSNPGRDHWMSQVLGFEVAQEISRRLSVINSDGRRVCGMKVYLPRVRTRLQELREKIQEEIFECLSNGMTIADTALTVRITIRDVFREKKSLISIGKLPATPRLPAPRNSTVLPARQALPAPSISTPPIPAACAEKQLWSLKTAIVDEEILKGGSNRGASMAAGVGLTYVRVRRKLLLASGRLKPGRIAPVTA